MSFRNHLLVPFLLQKPTTHIHALDPTTSHLPTSSSLPTRFRTVPVPYPSPVPVPSGQEYEGLGLRLADHTVLRHLLRPAKKTKHARMPTGAWVRAKGPPPETSQDIQDLDPPHKDSADMFAGMSTCLCGTYTCALAPLSETNGRASSKSCFKCFKSSKSMLGGFEGGEPIGQKPRRFSLSAKA